MVDVLLSTEDVTVLGGPSSISVDLDFGPQGERGSQIFVGNGNPNSNEVGQDIKVFDLYINIDPNDEEYLFLYQYQSIPGSDTWVQLFKLITNQYSKNQLASFASDGTSYFYIPLINIVPADLVGSLDSSNFNIQYSIVGEQDPTIITLQLASVESDPENSITGLKLQFKGIKFDGTDWINLEGNKTIDLFITVV